MVAHGPAPGGIHGRGAGIGEQVQEALARGQLADQSPGVPVVQEEAGVQIVLEVDQEPVSALGDLVEASGIALALVLAGALLLAADLEEELGLGDLQNLRDDAQCLAKATAGPSPGPRVAGAAYSWTTTQRRSPS